jgi:chemotaxis protein methyltransferase WspC
VQVLSNLLTPNGLLFVGPAEAGVLLNHALVSAKIPRAHAFRRRSISAPRDSQRTVAASVATSAVTRPAVQARPERAPRVRPRVAIRPAEAPNQSPTSVELDAATRLANDGKFVEAAARCAAHLDTHGPSAQVFYLLGLVRDADGRDVEAVACYRKALYLDPRHHDALVHLAVLMDGRDNKGEAERLRSRARRLSREGGAS